MSDVQSFWERVYIAAMDQGHRDRTPEVPWSIRTAEIADNAILRWKERFGDDGEWRVAPSTKVPA